jgi:hypothetical protein
MTGKLRPDDGDFALCAARQPEQRPKQRPNADGISVALSKSGIQARFLPILASIWGMED